MIDASRLRGVFAAIPTPVDADDRVDAAAASDLVAHLVREGIDGIVPVGGTGEYCSLARSERTKMVQLTVEAARGKVPVVGGVLDPGYHDALQTGKEFAAVGADALLLVTPYYTNPTQVGIRDYFIRYAEAAPLPIVIYEIPYRTRIAIEPEILHELSRHERIIGMKACNTNMYHFLRTVAGVDASFSVLSGEDTLYPLQVAGGAKGGIVVTASLLPRSWRAIHELASAGRTAEALAAHRELIPLMDMVFAETNPGPLKAVLDMVGIGAPRVLDPLIAPADELVARLRVELSRRLSAEAQLR